MVLASAAPAASQVVPGILGFLVVAGMGLILFFLLRSMNKQLRKVIPDPAWRKQASVSQNQAPAEEQQDYTTNGTAQS
jgi:hypothetical protein